MALIMTAAPPVEPVTLAEAKAHLRLDDPADDSYVVSLVVTSRMHIEIALGLALIAQQWSYFCDAWPAGGALELPLRPLITLDAVRSYAADASYTTHPLTKFDLDRSVAAPRLVARPGAAPSRPGRRANGLEVAFTAGFGAAAADVPAPIRQALLLLVAHWYEHRDPVEVGAPETAIPPMVSQLLVPWRTVRL